MPRKRFNRVRVATATTGTGSLTLGAARTGFRSFAEAGAVNGDEVVYLIEDGVAWEIGSGILTGTTLTRFVLELNDDDLLNLSGAAEVASTVRAQDLLTVEVVSAPPVSPQEGVLYVLPQT